jgi:hypothetical protein
MFPNELMSLDQVGVGQLGYPLASNPESPEIGMAAIDF